MFYHALTGGNGVPADLEPVLLWENPDVTAKFDAQTISLDLTKYAGVVIDFNRKTTTQKLQTRFYMKRDDVTNDGAFYACANQTDNVSRKVSLLDTLLFISSFFIFFFVMLIILMDYILLICSTKFDCL